MRISDWSSDVCSSDLVDGEGDGGEHRAEEVPDALVGEDLHLRVGGGEREDHSREREGEERGTQQVRLTGGPQPGRQDEARSPRTEERRAGTGVGMTWRARWYTVY